jgi:hypothetical protein
MKRQYKKFVFGETLQKAINQIPENEQLRFYRIIVEYGIDGIEPELSGFEAATWVQMKAMIDNTMPSRRGAPEGNSNAAKNKENNSDELFQDKSIENKENNSGELNSKNQLNQLGEIENNCANVNDNVNENQNDNQNINDNDGAKAPEYEYEKAKLHFLGLWQSNPDVFNPVARLKNPKDFDNWWKESPVTTEMIDLAVSNFLDGVRTGAIGRQFIPGNPDTFILNGGIQRYQGPYRSRASPKREMSPEEREKLRETIKGTFK